ncbi:hypothetical protein LOC71_11720 [Rhodopirellula sp. JC740]|jgi:hypothetical protein|uniref:Secreted protein n=1 Tax=Rhodopirellula halodulae TaxID=2894198 RepID=A0ABS8NHC8_9BACT|nr:hypothetical protein [Rhodopirellula sp. JC740]MCC9642947.1 hypothetical protein [Rhodopirellula sp. JC740]MCH1496442.1 hypothetical protein [Rubripirellula sp.]MDF1839924.1 hypothetical protein [Rubripirellula sp.]
MNRRHTNAATRLFAAFAVIAVLLASSPAARAGSNDAKPCLHACCQPQHVGHGCCDSDPLHECPAMASCELTVWLPPRTSTNDLTPRGLDRSDFLRIDWRTESVALVRSVSLVRPSSLIDWHIRLQI